MDDDPIRHRLIHLPPERLADELIDLGNAEPFVRDRLDLLAAEHDPTVLAAALQKRIAALGQGKDFVPYGRSFAFAHELGHIVDTIRERLLPHEPDLAFDLADAFLRSDATVFECVDDSAGAVGDVFRGACKLWLQAASQCRPKRDWTTLFQELAAGNDYGVRDELLPNAAILFPEEELRALAARWLAEARKTRPDDKGRNWEALSAATTASQLAIALRDPRLYEEAITAIGGGLNDLQRINVARRYLEFGNPEGALAKLSKMNRTDGLDRLDLLADCYGRLGKIAEQLGVLESNFGRTLSEDIYNEILTLRSREEAESTRGWAREIALSYTDACTAATFLFEAGWPDDAERMVLERGDEMASISYFRLQDLAALAETSGRRIVEVVCFRHLIRDILNDARSKAYGHAVKYYRTLEALDPLIGDYRFLGDHASFVAELWKQHGRKSAFWGRLEPGKQR